MEAGYGRDIAYTVVVRSDLTFLTKQSDNGTVVYAARGRTGEPAAGAEVLLYNTQAGRPFGQGRTDSGGIFRHRGASPDRSLIFLKKDDQVAVSDPEFFSSSFYGRGGTRLYIYTDRPIYRPGDQVYFKAIARDFANLQYRSRGGGATFSVHHTLSQIFPV